MPSSKSRKKVQGSEKHALPNSQVVGDVDPQEQIEITVLVRPRTSTSSSHARAAAQDALSEGEKLPQNRDYVSREDFAAERGADPADLAKIDDFAHEHHLTVTETNIAARTVKLTGTLANLMSAFQTDLKRYKAGSRTFRGRTGSLTVPAELANIVVGVFGFDNRPIAKPHYRRLDDMGKSVQAESAPHATDDGSSKKKVSPRRSSGGSYTPPQVAKLYDFPAGLDGSGQCIALIELNDFDNNNKITGTGFNLTDLNTYFKGLKLKTPSVVAVGVDGGMNMPGPDANADGEVMLDIEVAGSIAPGATIAVYFAPNTDQGFIDAVNAALHDNVRKPSVISISWGGPEDSSTQQFLNGLDQAFQDAAALGITVCCASGDDGSSDERTQRDGKLHVDFPSASTFALACGGTKLVGSGTTISQETVWNEGDRGGAGGGGVSNFFARPSYQSKSKVPRSPNKKVGRGVPDVCGNADPVTGYQVLTGGQKAVFGGTSAVAPLWAALIALINQRLTSTGKKSAGFINPLLYSVPAKSTVFHDIVTGNNDIDGTLGKYKAGKGWDACTGQGSPDGTKLMQFLGG